MSPDELAVLFEPYSRGTTQRRIKGVGLGVVIVKKLVDAHGGGLILPGGQFTPAGGGNDPGLYIITDPAGPQMMSFTLVVEKPE